MAEPTNEPSSTLVIVPTEMEATLIASVLRDEGVRTQVAGGATGSFRGDAPGRVKVIVFEADLSRAQEILRTVQQERGDIDWSQVDVGEPEDT